MYQVPALPRDPKEPLILTSDPDVIAAIDRGFGKDHQFHWNDLRLPRGYKDDAGRYYVVAPDLAAWMAPSEYPEPPKKPE